MNRKIPLNKKYENLKITEHYRNEHNKIILKNFEDEIRYSKKIFDINPNLLSSKPQKNYNGLLDKKIVGNYVFPFDLKPNLKLKMVKYHTCDIGEPENLFNTLITKNHNKDKLKYYFNTNN